MANAAPGNDAVRPLVTTQYDVPSFVAEAMLGRLARWLRVVGADTLQLPVSTPNAVLVARADAERRVLLTRIRRVLDYHVQPAYYELAAAVSAGQHHSFSDELWRYLNFVELLAGLRQLGQISDEEILK